MIETRKVKEFRRRFGLTRAKYKNLYNRIYAVLYYLTHQVEVKENSKRWKKRHPDGNKQHCRKNYQKNRQRYIAYADGYYANHPEKHAEWEARTYYRRLGLSEPPDSLLQLKIIHLKARKCLRKKTPIG